MPAELSVKIGLYFALCASVNCLTVTFFGTTISHASCAKAGRLSDKSATKKDDLVNELRLKNIVVCVERVVVMGSS